MKVRKDGLIKILSRQHKEYTKAQISSIIEEHGASYFNPNIEYLGFNEWSVPMTYEDKHGKIFTEDDLDRIYSAHNIAINPEKREQWKASQIECGNLKIKA